MHFIFSEVLPDFSLWAVLFLNKTICYGLARCEKQALEKTGITPHNSTWQALVQNSYNFPNFGKSRIFGNAYFYC